MPKSKSRDSRKSTQHEVVHCDLSFADFQKDLQALALAEFDHFFDVVEKKIQKMRWHQIYATSSKSQKRGLNWEVIVSQKTARGTPIATIGIDEKIRARVTRDAVFMRFVSLHRDHDSAYRQKGGEDI